MKVRAYNKNVSNPAYTTHKENKNGRANYSKQANTVRALRVQ